MPRLWDSGETAAYLAVKETHLRDMRLRGEIPYVKVGRLVRFRPAEVEAWLEAHTVGERAS